MSLLLMGLIVKTVWVIIGIALIIAAVKTQRWIFKDLFEIDKELQGNNIAVAIVVGACLLACGIFLGLLL